MKKKITLLGAGSGFTQPLFTDILMIEGLTGGTIGLVDVDRKRLEVNVKLLRKVMQVLGKDSTWKLEASVDRRDVLKGTDYLINTIEVSGVDCVRYDNDIPVKYGIDQCIGDTIGPGGIMKSLRTVPAWLAILQDARRYCPNAMILNYTNPMSVITLATLRSTSQPVVGLCHSVQGTTRHFANIAGVPYDGVRYRCAGINHMAWITEFKDADGNDIYERLRAVLKANPELYDRSPIPWETFIQFGVISTEGSGHYSEYVPWFRKRKDLVKKYCRPGYDGESAFYVNNWPSWRKRNDTERLEQAQGKREVEIKRSFEYASDIIEGHCFDRRKIIYASVANTNLIPNLLQSGVVEVAVMVDRNGFTPTYFGNLPEHLASVNRMNMSVFELVVQGILNQDREQIIYAMMMDPLTAACCSLAEIRNMTEELLAVQKDYIPAWCQRKPTVAQMAKGKGKDLPWVDAGAPLVWCRESAKGAVKLDASSIKHGMEEVSSMAARGAVARKKKK